MKPCLVLWPRLALNYCLQCFSFSRYRFTASNEIFGSHHVVLVSLERTEICLPLPAVMKSFNVKTDSILVANVQLKITASYLHQRLLSAFVELYIESRMGNVPSVVVVVLLCLRRCCPLRCILRLHDINCLSFLENIRDTGFPKRHKVTDDSCSFSPLGKILSVYVCACAHVCVYTCTYVCT